MNDSVRPPAPNVRRASLWVMGGYACSQGLRLVGNLILWRLLFAEAFGMMAIVNVFLQGLHMFADVGIGPSIIQGKRGDDPDFLNTAWTIQFIRGFLLATVASALAVPVSHFYDAPELATLIPVVALTTVFDGFYSTNLVTAKRNVALGRFTLVELTAQVTGLVTMIGLAWMTRSIWSLVVGGLAGAAMQMILSHTVLPGIRNRPRWDPTSVTALVHFGRWIFLSTLLNFAVVHSDRLIFGKLVSLELLGVYSVATVWAAFPRAIMAQLCGSVVFPVLSRAFNAGEAFVTVFRRTRLPWLVLAGWMVTCLVAGGPTLIRFLYDERAKEAGWIVQVLAGGAWFASLNSVNHAAILAQGRPKWMVFGNAAKLCGMALIIPIGFHLRGFPGAVFALTATELVSYLSSVVGLARKRSAAFVVDLLLSTATLLTSAFGFEVGRLAHPIMSFPGAHFRVSAFLEGTAIFAAVSGVWLLVWLVSRRVVRATVRP